MGRWCALKNYFVRKKAKRIVSIVQHRLQGTAQRGFEINLSHFISVHFWNSFNPKCLFGEMFTFFIHLSRNLTCPQSLQRKRAGWVGWPVMCARAEGRAFSPATLLQLPVSEKGLALTVQCLLGYQALFLSWPFCRGLFSNPHFRFPLPPSLASPIPVTRLGHMARWRYQILCLFGARPMVVTK